MHSERRPSPSRPPAFRLALAIFLAACSSHHPDVAPTAGEPVPVAPPSAPSAASSGTPTAPAAPPPPEEEGELTAGRRTFSGMVRPRKGGYEVRGVLIEDAALPDALAKSVMDGIPSDSEWFLGAVVRLTAEIVAHEDEVDVPSKGGLAEQKSAGRELTTRKIETVELVARAEMVEGVLQRSKGFFELGKYLVNRQDLGWALAGSGGGKEGDRVRLWGQPSIVHCKPEQQCLEGGSLPIFAIGRAEKLP